MCDGKNIYLSSLRIVCIDLYLHLDGYDMINVRHILQLQHQRTMKYL